MNNKRVIARVNVSTIMRNIRLVMERNPESSIMPVIKADAYGHGAVPIARYLDNKEGIWGFAVATADEAFVLRNSGVASPILILGYTFFDDFHMLIKEGIRPAVFTREAAKALSDKVMELRENEPGREDATAIIHIKVDTGMSRIGIRPDDEGLDIVEYISGLPGIEIEGIFTHFSRADGKDRSNALAANRRFVDFVSRIKSDLGIEIPLVHSQNSAGGIRGLGEEDLIGFKSIIRAGIVIYGMWPSDIMEEECDLPIVGAMSLESLIVYIKTIPPGTSVGYGGTFTAKRLTKIATIPVGYADGYPRSLSNKGYVYIRGCKAPIVGRVCMDALMVDVTDIPEVSEGDRVVLLGPVMPVDTSSTHSFEKVSEHTYEYNIRSRSESDAPIANCITAEELGRLSERFNYELTCLITHRVPRIYEYDE